MKNKIVIIAIILLLANCRFKNNQAISSNEYNNDRKYKVDTNQVIIDIKKEFLIINNNIREYKKVEKKAMEESSEGGQITAYSDNGHIKKIIEEYYGEMGKIINEYYFKNDELFFVYIQEYFYSKPITFEDYKVDRIEENRYYFYNNELIQWLNNNKQKVKCTSKSFKDNEKLIISESYRLKDLLK